MFHQNINGLVNKINKVRLFLISTHRNVHVYGIPETHTTPNISDQELEIDGYELVRKDREKGEYGGVLASSVLVLNIKEEWTLRSQDWRRYGLKFLS